MCTLRGNDLWATKFNEQIAAAAALSLFALSYRAGGGRRGAHRLHTASSTSSVPRAIRIYRAAPAQAELERPLPVGEQGCFSIVVSSSFSNDVILHALIVLC